jgi:hypothetical protein
MATWWYQSYPNNYWVYENLLDRTDQGMELELKTRWDKFLAFQILYNLASSKATGWMPLYAAYTSYRRQDTYPVDHDQTHSLVCRADLNLHAGEGFKLGSIHPLENTRVILLFETASGLPYTAYPYPQAPQNLQYVLVDVDLDYNSSRAEKTSSLSLRVERTVSFGDVTLIPFLWIENLLDRQNVTNVWRTSGQPDNTGFLQTSNGQEFIEAFSMPNDLGLTGEEAYRVLEQYPQNVGHPRMIYLGIRAAF